MKVSVLITTYNQEAFIAQALESVLAQSVDFPYEILIGEDASTDRTREIVEQFATKYPDTIRVLLADPTIAERDRARGIGGKTNFMMGFAACRGEYIALLDGDDYWTDPYKLQKQLDFLSRHPECNGCFHDVMVCYEDGSAPAHRMCGPDQKEISTVEDLLKGNFISTCSVVFRKMFGELPAWFYDMPTGDWPLHVLSAEYGKLGYINQVMATYRLHRKGFWSQQDYLMSLEKEMKIYKAFRDHFGSRYKAIISKEMSERFLRLAGECMQRGDKAAAKSFARQGLAERLRNAHLPSRNLSVTLLRLYLPALHKALGTLRGSL